MECYFLRYSLLLLFCLLFTSLYCQRTDLIDGGIYTGSGTIAFASPVKYSTIDYTREFVKRKNKDIFTSQSDIERALSSNRKRSLNKGQRSFRLRFHNHTSLRSQKFRSEVATQMEALAKDFIVDSLTYTIVMGESPRDQEELQIILLKDIGNNYNPSKLRWEGWRTFDGKDNHREHIDIHVVADLPEEVGHGFARFSWYGMSDDADIVINEKSFGSGAAKGFDKGKVLTHLMGNYFGLYPLTGSSACSDDGVYDTPIHNAPLAFCDPRLNINSSCDNQPVMSNNFMTHSPDVCKDSFTVGQWRRMLGIAEILKTLKK